VCDDAQARAVSGFLVDAAGAGLSIWTVVNVLRQWMLEGTPQASVDAAFVRARAEVPSERLSLIDEYRQAMQTLA
jgi:hypothetical protein